MSKQTLARSHHHQTENLIRHKPFIEISQPHFAFSAAGVDIHAGEAVTVLEIGVEIHPVTTQTRQSIAMPEKTRQAIELRRRIDAIEYAESLHVPEGGYRVGIWDRLGLWFVVAVVLVLIAYAVPLYELISMERFGSPGFKPY